MDFKHQLTDTQIYPRTIKGVQMWFTLRDPRPEEDLEYRRRSAKVSVRNGKIDTSDTAHNAALWLFDQICVQVTAQNGGPEPTTLSKEEVKEVVPLRARMSITVQHLNELEGVESEQIKN